MHDVKKFEPFWGNWYVKELIGEGGYGKVYRIEREEFGTVYRAALKYIKIPKSQSEVKSVLAEGMDKEDVEKYFGDFVSQLIKEVQLMAKVKGTSNIVSYEDHYVKKIEGKTEWHIFIRMELLTSLIDYVNENKITRQDVVKLGIDMCRALETCQKHNIIHRDIKPENIFISDNGDFKLGDFGIARQIEKTMAGLSKKGTYTYMAPEVYLGREYGSSVDIYSLGIVMYRFLNKSRDPFMPPYPQKISGSDKERALERRIGGEHLPKPVNAEGRLAEIILKACAYNPKDRYNRPGEMRAALQAILTDNSEAAERKAKEDAERREAERKAKAETERQETEMEVKKETERKEAEGKKTEQTKKKRLLIGAACIAVCLIVLCVGYAGKRDNGLIDSAEIDSDIDNGLTDSTEVDYDIDNERDNSLIDSIENDSDIDNGSENYYVVQAGDTLAKIAASELGSSSLYYLIQEANNMGSRTSLSVGDRLIIPDIE